MILYFQYIYDHHLSRSCIACERAWLYVSVILSLPFKQKSSLYSHKALKMNVVVAFMILPIQQLMD